MYIAEFESKRKVEVKGYVRKGKFVKKYNRLNKKGKEKKQNNNLRNVSAAAASLLGVSALGYGVIKVRYNAGIANSAKKALTKVNSLKLDNISFENLQRPNINFAVAGISFSEISRKSTKIASDLGKKVKGHTIPIDTSAFNTLTKKPRVNPLGLFIDLHKPLLETTVRKGYNPTSIDLAAQVFAYQKKYPDKIMSLHGHSSGAMVTNEAMLILEKMGAKMDSIKQITYGGSYYGLIPEAKNSLHLRSPNDIQAKNFSFSNQELVGKITPKKSTTRMGKFFEGHGLPTYMDDKDITERVKSFVTPPNWKPPTITKSKPAIANTLADIGQERKKVKEKVDKLRKLRSNPNIPPAKREAAEKEALRVLRNQRRIYKERLKQYKNN